MFELTAEKSALAVTEREPLVSGAVNVYQARFRFSRDWDGLEKTAVFHALGRTVSVLLEEDGCPVPWEVLERPGRTLYAGVYGTRDGTVVLPTVWAELGRVEPGAAPGDEALPPTPGAYGQLVDMAARAEETARALRADAEAGAFDGADGASGLLPVTRTGAAALTLAANTCAVATGRPGALSVTLGPPAGGTDTEWRLIFTAGEGFALTDTAPEGHALRWEAEPVWQAGTVYEVSYGSTGLPDAGGNTIIGVLWRAWT